MIFVIALLAGCASNPYVYNGQKMYSTSHINIEDLRSEKSINGGKESLFSFEVYLSDKKFSPSRLEIFKSMLSEVYGDKKFVAKLYNFDVIQNHAYSSGVAAAGLSPAMQAGIGSPRFDSDFLFCRIKSDVNGKVIYTESIAGYKPNLMALNVYNDPDFRRALAECVDSVVSSWKSDTEHLFK